MVSRFNFCFLGVHTIACSLDIKPKITILHLQLGGLFIWTYTYQLIRSSSVKFDALKASEEAIMSANKDLEANEKTQLLNGQVQESAVENTKSHAVSLLHYEL